METFYETDRLNLCVCTKAQAPLVADFYTRNYEDFARYETLIEDAKSANFHRQSLEYEFKMFKKRRFIRLYLFKKDNPFRIIGTVSYRDIKPFGSKSCTVGYKIDMNFRKNGYCKEALLCGNSIMFDDLGQSIINATVLPDNIASIKLLQSLGFINKGPLPTKIMIGNDPKEHLMFSLNSPNQSPAGK